MAFVVGPIDAATKRGLLGVENSAAAWRANFAAATLISWHSSSSPYSASTRACCRKCRSRQYPPPPRNTSGECRDMTSGRVSTRFSLQPSRAAPPKSSAVRLRCWIIVPIAPSSTRMRSSSNDFSSLVLSRVRSCETQGRYLNSLAVTSHGLLVHASGQTKTAIRISEARLARSFLFERPFAARTSSKADCLEQATVGAPASVGRPRSISRSFLMLYGL